MDPDEINNPEAGTDEITALTDDNAEEWTYFDPDEDQDTEGAVETEATDDGTDDADEAEAESAPGDVVVTLPDGSKAKVADLIQGNMRQDDYTRKTQELAKAREVVQADSDRIEGITQAFIDHLTGLLPQAPEPALALRDPNAYVRQKAQHEAALAQVQKLIEIGQQPKQIKDAMSEQDHTKFVAEENRKLSERFPETTTEAGRQKFFGGAAEAAQQIGFSMNELQGVTDHRMFVLAHYAKVGMAAMKARDTAKAKSATAPPVAPRKPGQGAALQGNDSAMRKFAKSPTVRNAVAAWDGN
jgi:hypothetical protein